MGPLTQTLASLLAQKLAKDAVGKLSDMSKFTPMNIRPVYPTAAFAQMQQTLGNVTQQRLAPKDDRPPGNSQWMRSLINFFANGNRGSSGPQPPPRQPDGVGAPPIQRDGLRAGTMAGGSRNDGDGQSFIGQRVKTLGAAVVSRSAGMGAGMMAGGAMRLAAAGGAAGLLAAALVTATIAAKRLGEAQAEGLKYLRAYNGQIAGAYARLSRGDLMRTRRQAAATAGSTTALVSAVNEMRDAWAPLENVATGIKNQIGIGGAMIATFAGKLLSFVAVIAERLRIISDDQKGLKAPPWQDTLNTLAAEYRKRNTPKGKR
jgi:hypothetical protein